MMVKFLLIYLFTCLFLVYSFHVYLFTCLHVYLFTSIYIKCCVSEFVPFCLSPGGHIILTHSTSIFHTRRGGANIFVSKWGQTFLYRGRGNNRFMLVVAMMMWMKSQM